MKSKLMILLFAGFMIACESDPMYEAYTPISEKGWYKDSIVSFKVDIEDTAAAYQVVWYLRNNNDYEFSNIYLFRQVSSERGIEFTDTAEFILADNYGKWLGRGIGELKTNTWPFKTGLLRFNSKGNYTFTLQQAMRKEYLQGVEDVGLGLYKIDVKENGKKES